ncbi:MAG TPA: hypothetical protein VG204_15175 [Terriglobia bacterium]|nr:hypothetical protein [Terriglobia bacterium]
MKTVLIAVTTLMLASQLGARTEAHALPAVQQSPTTSAPEPPAPVPSVPGQPAVATPSSTATTGGALTLDQVNDLLRKIYNGAYRVKDLLSLLEPDKWKMDETARKSFDATVQSLRTDLQTLEESRTQFSGQPRNVALGYQLDGDLRTALPDIDTASRAVSEYEGPRQGIQYAQAHDQLVDLERALKSYLDSLGTAKERASAPQVARGQPSGQTSAQTAALPQTENIAAPPSPPPPATTAIEVGYLTSDQVKVLLHRIYVAAFRLNDLLTQVQPGRWKVPEPVRDHFNLRVAKLRSDLKALDAARAQFSEQTDSPYLGYQTTEAIPLVISDLKDVDQDLTLFEGRGLSSQFAGPGQWLEESRQALKAYLEFMMRNWNQVTRTYEANLAACQNTLNYAMYGHAAAARPMEPVRFVRPLQSARIRRKEAEEAARRSEHPNGDGSSAAANEARSPSDTAAKGVGTPATAPPPKNARNRAKRAPRKAAPGVQ